MLDGFYKKNLLFFLDGGCQFFEIMPTCKKYINPTHPDSKKEKKEKKENTMEAEVFACLVTTSNTNSVRNLCI